MQRLPNAFQRGGERFGRHCPEKGGCCTGQPYLSLLLGSRIAARLPGCRLRDRIKKIPANFDNSPAVVYNVCKERKVDAMRYWGCGVKIQYRECQILRETAGEIAKRGRRLAESKEEWIELIGQAAHANDLKASYAAPMMVFLENISEDLYEAVSEYAEHLVAKGRGIDIMIPFEARNGRVVLPVNLHASMGSMED